MAAQTITPVALGSLLLIESFNWGYLPVYAAVCLVISLVIFFFVKSIKSEKVKNATGLEALGQDD